MHKYRKIDRIVRNFPKRYQHLPAYKWNDRKVCAFFLPVCIRKMFPFLSIRCAIHWTHTYQVSNNKFSCNSSGTRIHTRADRQRERYAKVLLVPSKVHCSFIRSNIVQEEKASRKNHHQLILVLSKKKCSERCFSIFLWKTFLLQSFCSNFYLIFLFLSLRRHKVMKLKTLTRKPATTMRTKPKLL